MEAHFYGKQESISPELLNNIVFMQLYVSDLGGWFVHLVHVQIFIIYFG